MVEQNDSLSVRKSQGLQGSIRVPGDKSISHRAVLFGMLAQGVTHVRGWLAAGDTEASLRAVRALGVQIDRDGLHELTIYGGELREADAPLDLVNAGTGIRLLAGIMVGQPFASVLDGSEQLRRRPMKRIITPLRMMGADISAMEDKAPLTIKPAQLTGIRYDLPMASAQVKSAVLLAGLFAKGTTAIVEPGPARDHTERMLRAMGADIAVEGSLCVLKPNGALKPLDLTVPGDFSSAAFPMVAAAIVPDSDVTIVGVNLNETRTGLLDALRMMGVQIEILNLRDEGGEPAGDLRVRHSTLKGVEIGGELVVRMIDEFPIFMLAALCAEGRTVVRDAQELRVKETDRLKVMTAELTKLGAEITETEDGFIIDGQQRLKGAVADGHDDHRIAMSMAIAGLIADGETIVNDISCAADSFPGFPETLIAMGGQIVEPQGR